MGWGPQEGFSDNINKLLYAASPQYDSSRKIQVDRGPQAVMDLDPNKAMISAINRDAYVNETLGGNFAGGVIPEYTGEEKVFHPGIRDPHFATPNVDAQGNAMLTPGWASNQATQFGSLPYDAFAQQQYQQADSGNNTIWTGADQMSMMKDHGNFDPYSNLMGQFPIASMNASETAGLGASGVTYSPYNDTAKAIESNGGVWGGAYGGSPNSMSFNQGSVWGGDTNKNPWGSNVWG